MKGLPPRFHAICLALLALSLVGREAVYSQGDGTWKEAGGNGTWSDLTKWEGDPAVAPGGIGASITFISPFTGGHATLTLDGERTVGTFIFGGPSSRNVQGATGSSLTFDNGAAPAELRLVTEASGELRFINIPSIVLASSLIINDTTGRQLSFSNTAISGTGGIIKNGPGTVTLSYDMVGTYTGGFTLNGGRVVFNTNSAFGTGLLTLNSGTLARPVNGGSLTIANAFVIGGDIVIDNSNVVSTTFSGAGILTGNRILTVEGNNAVIFTGGVDDGGNGYSFTKAGSGMLTVSTKAFTHTGATVVESGTLAFTFHAEANINASSSLTIDNGGFFLMEAGGNKIGDSATVTLNAGGTLAMGTRFDTVGTLVLDGGSIIGGATGRLTASTYDIRSGMIDKGLGDAAASTLTKTTSGTATLSQAAVYTGATTINAGTLHITESGAINSTSSVTINGGKLKYDSTTALNRSVILNGGALAYNSSANYTGALAFAAGTLAGTNWNGSLNNLTISTNRVISPGENARFSAGIAQTGNQTWAAGGNYLWEINQATGTEGVNWDILSGTGSLTITATEANPFTIRVASFTLENLAGDAANFDASQNYLWRIAVFANPIAFDPSAFVIDTTDFSNAAHGGLFSLHLGSDDGIGGNSTELWLVYMAIPEASGLTMVVWGAGTILGFRRRRKA